MIGSGGRPRKHAALFFVALALAATGVSGCGDKPVATLNGQSLSEAEFYHLCETATQIAPNRGTVGQQVLMQWVGNTLMMQEAKRLNVYPSDKDVNDRIQAFRKQAEYTGQSFDDQLKQKGMTPEAFKREMTTALVFDNLFYRGIDVSDADLRQAYDQQKARITQPESIQISQITVDSKAKADQARSDLGTNTTFELVAQSLSKDQFAKQGGRIPIPFTRRPMQGFPVDPKVIAEAFKLKEGQHSDPIQVGSTWVIVRVDKRVPEKVPAFEDVKELLRAQLRQQRARANGKFAENQKIMLEATRAAKLDSPRPEYQNTIDEFKRQAAATHINTGNEPAGGDPTGGAPGAAPPGVPPGP
jgi:foldase protein PrsA